MSEEMGVAKPDPAFFGRALRAHGRARSRRRRVRRRPARQRRAAGGRAGMRAVWLRRGPWGVINAGRSRGAPRVGSLAELVDRIDELRLAGPAGPAGAARVTYATHVRAQARPPLRPSSVPPVLGRETVEAAWSSGGPVGRPAGDPGRRAASRTWRSSTPADPAHGDLASNLALKLARPLRRPPMAIAEAIAAELRSGIGRRAMSRASRSRRPGSSTCGVADAASWSGRSTRHAPPATPSAGSCRTAPQPSNVEFVSANPTGPLTVGNARGAFVGDLLCRVLEAAGHDVTREYYFNDSGRQVRVLGASVAARRRGEELPEEAYRGAYVDTLAGGAAGRRLGSGDRTGRRPRRHRRARGRPSGSGRASRPASRTSASGSTSGRARRRCTQDGWVERAVERLRERRPRVRAGRRDLVPLDRRSATTRTGSSIAPTGSPPTSRRTSATSPRSSAAASTSSSTSGAPTTTAPSPASATPRRRWASTPTPWRCCWSPGCASCATARRSR